MNEKWILFALFAGKISIARPYMLQLGEFFLAIYTFGNGVCIYGVDDEVIFIMTIYHYGQNSVTVLAGVGQEII